MGEPDTDKCPARARHKLTRYGEPHTFKCQKPKGHDDAHMWKDDARTVIWFGDSPLPDNTRMRFGRWVEAK